jgi:NADH:ubiquinone oxidoreductase subunit 2 (subunit N)
MISAISVFYYIRIIKVIFFESKKIQSKNDMFQTVFKTGLFEIDCLVLSISLFGLIGLFFYPTTLLLICQYIVLNTFYI